MRELDAAAGDGLDELIGKAGSTVADVARDLLADADGRRVAVLAGPGNNGADGRVAAAILGEAGYEVAVVDVIEAGSDAVARGRYDLLIDAAYGTGFRGEWTPPPVSAERVLAVDVPTGLDGLTGRAAATTLRADVTVTFDALKPGHLLADGPDVCGSVVVAVIGLDVVAEAWVADDVSIAAVLPTRSRTSHKWSAAVRIVAGQPGMSGAAYLASAAAQRAGAGMVVLSTPGSPPSDVGAPLEVVVADATGDWVERTRAELDHGRFHSFVIGPGLGRAESTTEGIRELVGQTDVPVVVDGDALFAVGAGDLELLARRGGPAVITPHDGEYRTLLGESPSDDRLQAANRLAEATSATVVLKGGPTIVATSGHTPTIVANGDQRLATAGTGDVLAGIIGAFLAAGCDPHDAAVAGAYVHAAAANRRPPQAMIASDLIGELVGAINALVERC